MKAEKIILETDQYGQLLHQPNLPPNTRMEAIFLMPERKRESEDGSAKKRKPSPLIMGKGRIIDDIMSPACPAEEWDVMK
jgi:hypothetical protein